MNPTELVATLRLAMLRSTLPQQQHPRPSAPRMIQGAVESTHSSSTSDDPRVLTAQIAQPIQYPSEMKETPHDRSGGSGRDEWVADSGASYHVTGDPTGMFDCKPPRVGKERLVIGDMTMIGVDCFGTLSLLMHCQSGDTHARLTNVAYGPGSLSCSYCTL